MITCKEDLVNTYIENDKGVLRDVYVSVCELHGYNYCENSTSSSSHVELHDGAWLYTDFPEATSKQLTLTDLLPTTYENTKVYSLDEDVIRKYAELCGVEYNNNTTHSSGEYVGVSWLEADGDEVERFTDDSDVHSGEYTTTTLTQEQILAAWDLKFNQPMPLNVDLDCDFLQWIHDRLECVHKENFNMDYMHRLRKIIDSPSPMPQVPKTRTEYVKIEFEDTLDLIDGDIMIESDLHFQWSESNVVPISEVTARDLIMNRHKLVRRTEKEVTWQEQIEESFGGIEFSKTYNSVMMHGNAWDQSKFIEMCHLVTSLTGKPE